MNDKLYLFNPFDIENWSDQQVKQQFEALQKAYIFEAVSPIQIAYNIENVANQRFLLGEMVSRYGKSVQTLKAQVKSQEALYTYKQRDQWLATHTSKPPAMSYFEALASDFVKQDRIELADKESRYKRFVYAYESFQDKENALKKRLEATKYEEFGG